MTNASDCCTTTPFEIATPTVWARRVQRQSQIPFTIYAEVITSADGRTQTYQARIWYDDERAEANDLSVDAREIEELDLRDFMA